MNAESFPTFVEKCFAENVDACKRGERYCSKGLFILTASERDSNSHSLSCNTPLHLNSNTENVQSRSMKEPLLSRSLPFNMNQP